jgi:GDP-L-fucose synthase
MRILVTGKNGLVGRAIQEEAMLEHHWSFVGREIDLTKEKEVESLFLAYKPDWVIHTAAKVGGIGGNLIGPANYFYENILMNSYMIHFAWKYGVKKFLVFSSVCVFPDGIPELREDLLHSGEPFYTQFAYGAAKRAIDTQIRAYKQQYGIENYCSIIPTNILGKNDYYNLTSGHVVPSLIHKIYLAKRNKESLKVWGDGTPKREFIYANDLAKMLNKILLLDKVPERIIVSNNKQFTIKEVVEMLCRVAEFKGEIEWQTDKPNGQMARPSNTSLLKSLIGEPEFTNFEAALSESYKWFESHYPNVRI